MRWLFHVVLARDWRLGENDASYGGALVAAEGFLHASFRDAVAESARLYFAEGAELVVLQIDPRRLGVPVVIADTPRGPMPHIHGALPRAAIARVLTVAAVALADDRVDVELEG